MKGECASVIGNVAILHSDKIQGIYHNIMNAFKAIISLPSSNQDHQVDSHEVSLLKAKCLEGVALVGKAVGKKMWCS